MSGTDEISEQSSYRATGQLNFVTGAFGVQVAPNLAVGAALSMVVGKGTEKREFLRTTDGIIQVDPLAESDNFEDWNSRRYLGYDFRVGLKYSLERFAIGLRIVAPSFIRFTEEYEYVYPSEDNIVYKFDYAGRLGSPASVAVGASTSLPFATISSEVEARVPDPYADEDRPLGRWKVGAGGGIEMPLFVETFLLRAGYRYNEYDKYPFMLQYNKREANLPHGAAAAEETVNDEHLITGGIAFLAGSAIAFEMSYGFRFWEIYPVSWRREKHTSHRVLASFTVGY